MFKQKIYVNMIFSKFTWDIYDIQILDRKKYNILLII